MGNPQKLTFSFNANQRKFLQQNFAAFRLIGTSIRLDTTLVDFNEMKWERGDITFLYKGDATQSKDSFFILDNKLGVYQRVLI
jgi:GPCR-chaperone